MLFLYLPTLLFLCFVSFTIPVCPYNAESRHRIGEHFLLQIGILLHQIQCQLYCLIDGRSESVYDDRIIFK